MIYARETRIDAPFERVWDFQVRVEGLAAVTPDWMHLRIEGVSGPDGDPDPETLAAGAIVRLSVRPFRLGPRQVWTTRIASREDGSDQGELIDEMIDGPFETWEHTHVVYADDGGTLLRDRVEYEFPVGPFGPVVDPVAALPMELLFRFRHRRTRELLERGMA